MTNKKEDKKIEILKEISTQEERSFETEPADESAVLENEENQMYVPDNFDDEYESSDLLTGEQYDVPDDADAFIGSDGNVLKKEDMSYWEIIKSIAQQNNVEIQDPLKGCKHCYGRGYDGIDSITKMPFPCRCIFRGRTDAEKDAENFYDSTKMNKRISRKQKRRIVQHLRRQNRHKKKTNQNENKKEMSSREINKILKKYIQKESLKKTASSLNMTLSSVKRTVKNNRDKLEKLKKKGA